MACNNRIASTERCLRPPSATRDPLVGHLQRAENPKAHRSATPLRYSSPASVPAAGSRDHPTRSPNASDLQAGRQPAASPAGHSPQPSSETHQAAGPRRGPHQYGADHVNTATHRAHHPPTPDQPGTVLTALGVLIAIAVTIMFITLTGTHHTTAAIPATTPNPPLPPPRTPTTSGHANSRPQPPAASAAAGEPAAHYACLGAAQRCLR